MDSHVGLQVVGKLARGLRKDTQASWWVGKKGVGLVAGREGLLGLPNLEPRLYGLINLLSLQAAVPVPVVQGDLALFWNMGKAPH